MRTRRRRRGQVPLPEVSLTPLIDTALVLLVIFMVATPILHNSVAIDLPEGQMKEDQNPSLDACVISITDKEQIELDGKRFDLDGLLKELTTSIATMNDKRVYVQCDKQASSGLLVRVIDSIKYVSGVEHVILSTERIR